MVKKPSRKSANTDDLADLRARLDALDRAVVQTNERVTECLVSFYALRAILKARGLLALDEYERVAAEVREIAAAHGQARRQQATAASLDAKLRQLLEKYEGPLQ